MQGVSPFISTVTRRRPNRALWGCWKALLPESQAPRPETAEAPTHRRTRTHTLLRPQLASSCPQNPAESRGQQKWGWASEEHSCQSQPSTLLQAQWKPPGMDGSVRTRAWRTEPRQAGAGVTQEAPLVLPAEQGSAQRRSRRLTRMCSARKTLIQFMCLRRKAESRCA